MEQATFRELILRNVEAKNAAASGLDGVVCSPLEAALVKERCGADFRPSPPASGSRTVPPATRSGS